MTKNIIVVTRSYRFTKNTINLLSKHDKTMKQRYITPNGRITTGEPAWDSDKATKFALKLSEERIPDLIQAIKNTKLISVVTEANKDWSVPEKRHANVLYEHINTVSGKSYFNIARDHLLGAIDYRLGPAGQEQERRTVIQRKLELPPQTNTMDHN